MKETTAKTQLSFPFMLNNNHLKLIAMLAMLCDHVGLHLLPQFPFLRIIGRLAYPIFAYMIAEGCTHTRSKAKYLRNLALLALLCQAVYFFAMGSLYQSILVTFSLSVVTICCFDAARKHKSSAYYLLLCAELITVCVICVALPKLRVLRDFSIDYGLPGVLFPVAVYIAPKKSWKLLAAAIMLVCLGYTLGGIQWYGLCALLLLALYDGTRGKHNLKYLFYIFYPAHLVIIYLIGLFM